MPKGTFRKSSKSQPTPRVGPSVEPPARSERDALGRLLPGHGVKSPGNPHARRIKEYDDAIRAAVTPEELCAVVVKIKKLAMAGDMDAARELLNRMVGKAKPADSSLAGIVLPDITTPQDIVHASNAILKAITAGKLTADDAAKLGSVVEMARRSIETNELAERLTSLEKAVQRD